MYSMGFSSGSAVKNPPAMQEAEVRSLGREDALEKEMATHSSIPEVVKESETTQQLNNNKYMAYSKYIDYLW